MSGKTTQELLRIFPRVERKEKNSIDMGYDNVITLTLENYKQNKWFFKRLFKLESQVIPEKSKSIFLKTSLIKNRLRNTTPSKWQGRKVELYTETHFCNGKKVIVPHIRTMKKNDKGVVWSYTVAIAPKGTKIDQYEANLANMEFRNKSFLLVDTNKENSTFYSRNGKKITRKTYHRPDYADTLTINGKDMFYMIGRHVDPFSKERKAEFVGVSKTFTYADFGVGQ